MPKVPKRIIVTSDCELVTLLEEAAKGPLLLEKDGNTYRLQLEGGGKEDIWAGYDPEAVRKAIDETAGSWADLDTDAMIAAIYRAREEGSRPPDRP